MDFSSIQIDTTIPTTPRVDDEIVDVEDGDKDAPEKVVAPQVIEGDN